MDGQDWVLIIGAVGTLVSTFFAGLIALRQIPRMEARQEESKTERQEIKADVAKVKAATTGTDDGHNN